MPPRQTGFNKESGVIEKASPAPLVPTLNNRTSPNTASFISSKAFSSWGFKMEKNKNFSNHLQVQNYIQYKIERRISQARFGKAGGGEVGVGCYNPGDD